MIPTDDTSRQSIKGFCDNNSSFPMFTDSTVTDDDIQEGRCCHGNTRSYCIGKVKVTPNYSCCKLPCLSVAYWQKDIGRTWVRSWGLLKKKKKKKKKTWDIDVIIYQAF